MKLIELYKEWMETGVITEREWSPGFGGLCNCVPEKYINQLDLFVPINNTIYWASEVLRKDCRREEMYGFNDLRQTIVLLICAMNDEI